jgi:hypothetical protein
MEPKARTTGWLIAILILIGVVFLIYVYRGAIYGEMGALKLIPGPERFTELYFTDPASLPTSTTSGETLSFSFTINNLEGATTAYPYVVYFQTPTGGSIVLRRDTISLADNASTTIPISYTFASLKKEVVEQGEVVVNLPTLNDQQIDFLLPDTN